MKLNPNERFLWEGMYWSIISENIGHDQALSVGVDYFYAPPYVYYILHECTETGSATMSSVCKKCRKPVPDKLKAIMGLIKL